MWKQFAPICLLFLAIGTFFVGCRQDEAVSFPQADAFSAEIHLTSVEKTLDGNYRLGLETVLHNTTQQTYTIYGNPTCWNMLYVNGQGEAYDLPFGYYTLSSGGQLTEQKEIQLKADAAVGTEMYVISGFYIEHADGTRQTYAIQSPCVSISEEDLDV